ncbi:MAG: D-arabinono-1,4-lactone oxidase [Candidatus Nanopelagicales bacterium]
MATTKSSKAIGRNGTWRNWGHTAQAKPANVYSPANTGGVSALVSSAAQQGRTIRMIGAGHSFTSTAVADDMMLLPDNLQGVRHIDPAGGSITVEAGINLTRLCEVLHSHGLALTNMGDIRVQSLAGALQTGTHGTGRDTGTFADMVTGLELVVGDGSVITTSATQNPDIFNAARVGLGAFGIVTAVTLAVEPAFRLRAHEAPAKFDEVVESFDEWTATHDHVEFYWFPHTEGCYVKYNDRTTDPAAPPSAFKSWWEEDFMANTVFGATCRFSRTAPGYTPFVNKIAAKALSDRTYTDDSWRVFTSPRRVRFAEMEYALPRESLLPALADVKKLLSEGPWRISFPIEVRSVPGDTSWLSPATGRDTGYIAVHAFDRTDRDWFLAVEAIMRGYQGRPHWGKINTRTAADLRPAYPNWDKAMAVRDQLDPQRVFANVYTRAVLGE